MNKIVEDQKILTFVLIGIIFLVVVLLVKGCGSTSEKVGGLKVSYNKDKVISYDSFSKSFKKERTITVKNTTESEKTYSLEWSDVENTLKKQNAFLYEIDCEGDGCKILGKSQIPVAAATVFPEVKIKAGDKHVYTVKFNYSGSEKDVHFKGTLQLNSKVIDTKKQEEARKKQEEKIKKAEAAAKAKKKTTESSKTKEQSKSKSTN